MEHYPIASFVLRFHLAEIDKVSDKKLWRIRVNHVQCEEETLFESIEEAMNYMKKVVGIS
ncbi:hypothetical protein ACE38V_00445 [Cytobacillus sp. Hz8]|uniref:hypothetical protein n=1 Tax=Cytobacillus sp. Hz8 TaxID=3347168 RepID=UPI0035DD60A0